MDSTLMGQSFFLPIKEGMCNKGDKGCTVLAGKVSLMYTDGKQADPSNGMILQSSISRRINF